MNNTMEYIFYRRSYKGTIQAYYI